MDLVAREAHYHPFCRKAYTRTDERNPRAADDSEKNKELEAHNAAFQFIIKHVEESIINASNVERVTMIT